MSHVASTPIGVASATQAAVQTPEALPTAWERRVGALQQGDERVESSLNWAKTFAVAAGIETLA
jgi:hypothetical protein